MAKLKLNIPVKRGDRLELDVETLASSGDGLCRHEGYTLFTPGGLPGDRVLGKIIKTTPRFGVVDVLKRIELSKDRVDPPCPVFFKCGGCKFQYLNYEKQLQFKVQVVKDSLQRIAHIEIPENIEIIPADTGYQYRNKGSFAVQGKGGKPQIGFYAEKALMRLPTRPPVTFSCPLSMTQRNGCASFWKNTISLFTTNAITGDCCAD